MADQAGWHGVEDLAQGEAARPGHRNDNLLEVRGPALWQRLQMGSLCINAPAMSSVATADDLVDKGAVRTEVVEFLGPPHQQGIMNSVLEMAMGAFDRAVLMRDALVIARRGHPIMRAKLVVTACEIDLGVGVEVARKRLRFVCLPRTGPARGPGAAMRSCRTAPAIWLAA